MNSLLFSLGGGVAGIALLFFALYRLTTLRGYPTAAVVALITLLLFVPWSILSWQGADVFAIHLAFFILVPYGLGIITTQLESERGSKQAPAKRRWHWFPLTLAGFFSVIAVVNGLLIYLATQGMPAAGIGTFLPEPLHVTTGITSGFPGTVAGIEDRKQALVVTDINRWRDQERLGWQVRQGWLERPIAGQEAVLQVEIRDQEGQPLVGAQVSGQFLRITDQRLDQVIQLENIAPGHHQARVTLPLEGRWDLVLQIRQDEHLHTAQASTRVLPDRAPPDRIPPDRILPDRAPPDPILPDRILPDPVSPP